MTPSTTVPYAAPSAHPYRLGAGLLIVLIQWLVIKVPEWVAPTTMVRFFAMLIGPLGGLLAVAVWWVFFSRFSGKTRATGLGAFLVVGGLAFRFKDPSMGMPMVVTALPLATTIWVLWSVFAAKVGGDGPVLRGGIAVMAVLVWGVSMLLRMEGSDGTIRFTYAPRWGPTAEDRYVASLSPVSDPVKATTTQAIVATGDDWPAFRGPRRDGVLDGLTIRTDWASRPPRQSWKHAVGPGWSSFSVIGDRAFTQEQRGAMEAVVCYDANSGRELWAHRDQTRFYESLAGPGPRATPTFEGGNLYTLGATGKLNCLDPASGAVIWSRDMKADTGAPLPPWGFSSSPLVAQGLVYVLSGADGKSVAAYHADTGEPAWKAGSGWSYSSIQLETLGGQEQVLYISLAGLTAMKPLNGEILWQHAFPLPQGNRCTQPIVTAGGDVIFGSSFGAGTRRLHVSHDGGAWSTSALWTSKSIQPYYNDMVLHQGNLYGFDGNALVCIAADNGKPRWRTRGYGNGQVLLLADQDLLVVLAESGEAALVDAKPDAYREQGKFQAIEGKTWNHPVIQRGRLFARNGQEAAVFELQ